MARAPEQTTTWVAETIAEMGEVQDTTVVGPHSLRITRNKFAPFVAGVVSVPVVTPEIVHPVLEADSLIEILVNVPKESMWTGLAITAVAARGIAFGGLGDLMSAISDEDVRRYTRSEYDFVERGLRQHTRVLRLDREADRAYLVHRHDLPPLRFVMLKEYELTGDHVRTARDRYGAFDAVLLNNPNGKPTTNALEVARDLGVGIFKWGQFLGRLNGR
jgi:hypothetical protein